MIRRFFNFEGYIKESKGQRIALAWLTAAVGVVAVALFAWRIGLDVLPLALAAETRLTEVRQLSNAEFAVSDGESLDELRGTVDRIRSEVRPAARSMTWLARFSPGLAWIPGLDHEIVAWSVQAHRLQGDVEAASDLLTASSQLLEGYGSAQSSLSSLGTEAPFPHLSGQARELESTFAATHDALVEVADTGMKRRPILRVLGVGDAMPILEEVEERMLAASEIGRQASRLLVDLLELGDRVRPLVEQLVVAEPESEPLTAAELRDSLAELDGRLESVSDKSSGLAKLVADTGQSDQLLGRLDLLRVLLDVLLAVNRATLVLLQAVEPGLQAAQAAGKGLLGGDGALVGVLNGVFDHEDELRQALAQLNAAQGTLPDLNSSGDQIHDVQGLENLTAAVDLLREGLQLVIDIAPVGAELVGVDSTRRYLVLAQSADELRATGGFVSGLWLVTFEDGRVADIRYHDTVLVDATERLMLYPPAPPGLEEHMYANVWLLRDVSWEPDFPTAARTAADLYNLGQRQQVDGVVALNQWTLLSLVEGLTSVSSPGGGPPLTARNLLSKLEEGTDEHGRAYVDVALQGVLDRVNEPMSLSTMMRLASALQGSLRDRDLLIFVDDPAIQEVISENGWDGRVRQDAADYLYVVDSNVGWSKADRYIERRVSYRVDLQKESGARISLTLKYNNHGGPGSTGCVPQWLNKGTNYDQLKNACYWNYWRVYIPQGARLLSNTPLPLPEYSVSVDTGRGQPGEDTVRVSSSYNKTVLSGLFALGAGEANEVNLVYDLPAGLQRREGKNIEYQMLIQKQPGSRRREVSVEFRLPPGYRLASSSVAPASRDGSLVKFLLRVEEDTVLDALFARVDDGSG